MNERKPNEYIVLIVINAAGSKIHYQRMYSLDFTKIFKRIHYN